MLQPKRIKHRKVHRPKIKAVATRGYYVSFGSYGLKAMASGWLTGNQLESARRTISRCIQRGGKLWIRVFPNNPRTQKGAETPMGGGSGSLSHFITPIEAGRIIFELDGVEKEAAYKALRLAGHKLPISTKIVERQ
ncbi:MAG: 50S ribosomal protein L16 [Parcubacteria group bacterium Licking1014_17]|nr:MAG: 50S ribosomal protein L16 [Parcubacteria group bacterium Licking1014_17]